MWEERQPENKKNKKSFINNINPNSAGLLDVASVRGGTSTSSKNTVKN